MSDRAHGGPIGQGQPYILGPAGQEPAQRPHIQAPKPAPTDRRVLFIDGPAAGQLHVIPADRSAWLVMKQIRDPEATYSWDISYTQICYQPLGGGSQHHDPQPWTCQRPPANELELQHALAKAWCHLHGPERS